MELRVLVDDDDPAIIRRREGNAEVQEVMRVLLVRSARVAVVLTGGVTWLEDSAGDMKWRSTWRKGLGVLEKSEKI